MYRASRERLCNGLSLWIIMSLGFFLKCSSLQYDDTPVEEEFCQWDIFNATCGEGEVIVMRTARYGRMKLGKCLTTDYFVGCSADVLSHVDSRCSGRRTCIINVPDPGLFNVQPCRKDLIAYFSASYSCVKVETGGELTCSEADRGKLPSSGYLSTYIARERGVGTPGCPWRLQALPGQTINLTLYDFATWKRSHFSGESYDYNSIELPAAIPTIPCMVVGTVFDGGKTSDIRVCRAQSRSSLVYSSKNHKIDISFLESEILSDDSHFLLKYEASGCANLEAPPNAYSQHQGDIAVVRCNSTRKSWHLICRDTTWMGEIGNCTEDVNSQWHVSSKNTSPTKFPFGILIAVGIGIILGILIGMIFLFSLLICQKRHKRQKHARVAKESNALLQDHCIYSDRETMGMSYKMIDLRQAGTVTSDLTSEVQAVELCAGPQCEACNLSHYFPCGPQDSNIYEVSKTRNNHNSMGTFRSNGYPGSSANSEFPPPTMEIIQDCQHEEEKCSILDLVPTHSQPKESGKASKPTLNSSYFGTADTLPHASRHSSNTINSPDAQADKLPVDLTAPCNTR